MIVRRIERIAINVPDLDAAMEQFTAALGLPFEAVIAVRQPGGKDVRAAISSAGLELLQETPPNPLVGLRSGHFRTDNLEAAAEQIRKSGGKVLGTFRVGSVEHMITELMGVRLILVCYDGDSIMEAMRC